MESAESLRFIRNLIAFFLLLAVDDRQLRPCLQVDALTVIVAVFPCVAAFHPRSHFVNSDINCSSFASTRAKVNDVILIDDLNIVVDWGCIDFDHVVIRRVAVHGLAVRAKEDRDVILIVIVQRVRIHESSEVLTFSEGPR